MNPATSWKYAGGDSCADFFTQCIQGYPLDLPENAKVLEIGCAEFDWLTVAKISWPAYDLTGIDWRGHKRRRPDVTVIQGDAMVPDHWEPATFDWVVSVSAIEHVGLGHYDRDPKAEDGDSRAILNAWRWLKPGGWLTFDVPWNVGEDAYEVVGTSHRVYDDATVQSRLAQGLPWNQAWTGCAHLKASKVLVSEPVRLKGGELFYYRGFQWQKPSA